MMLGAFRCAFIIVLARGAVEVMSLRSVLSPSRMVPVVLRFPHTTPEMYVGRSWMRLHLSERTKTTVSPEAPKRKSISPNNNISNPRRKMGPPQRKYTHQDEKTPQAGRVSVYCVGAAIDIQALRIHVFRRGFSSGQQQFSSQQSSDTRSGRELVLTRRPEDESIDDEVLHVSNAPLFIPASSSTSREEAHDRRQLEDSSVNDEKMMSDLPSNVVRDEFGEERAVAEIDTGKLVGGAPTTENSASSKQNEVHDAQQMQQTQLEQQEEDPQTSWKNMVLLGMASQDIFYFEYGCVVFWGLTSREEKAALAELVPFIIDPIEQEEIDNSHDTMEYVFDKSSSPQRPIRFDRMKLRSLKVEEKLALSYAMAQSSKLFVFEANVLTSVERTRYLPKELATRGRIDCTKKELNMLIGELFVEQTEVNLFSSILDKPDFLWDDDEYFPTYEYTRSYLEVDHRVALLNSRLSVIRELLDVLNAQVADGNSTRLEWIIIWLISVEIIIGIASSPLFVGRRVASAILVPTIILLYKQFGKD